MAMSDGLTEIAHKIIVIHRDMYEESLSPMKLQKLCYYAAGYYLAFNGGQALFEDDFQAWRHGPVVPDMYNTFRDFGWQPIDSEINIAVNIENDEVDEFLTAIVQYYGSYDGATLSRMTHNESPWIDARIGLDEHEGSSNIISKESIHHYFRREIEN